MDTNPEVAEIQLNEKLIFAASFGHIDVVKQCIREGADIHYQDDDPLHGACAGGQYEVVKYLVRTGADIHAYGEHALKMACKFGHLEIVKFLVKNGAIIDESVIQTARGSGKTAIVTFLEIERQKGQPNPNQDLNNKLIVACKYGNLKEVKKCIRKGADVCCALDDPLQEACAEGQLEVAKYLVRKGACMDTCNGRALILACHHGRFEIVKFLVEEGADITESAIRAAKLAEQSCLVLFLENERKKRLSTDESTDDESENDESEKEESEDDIDALNKELLMACTRGNLDKVKECLRKGADIHFDEEDPLHEACANGHLKVVKYLVDEGADIHHYRDHALVRACENDQFGVAEFLIEKGANVDIVIAFFLRCSCNEIVIWLRERRKNKPSEEDETGDESENDESEKDESEKKESEDDIYALNKELLMACTRGNLEEVKECLRKGADIHFDEEDPLYEACANGHLRVVKYLVDEGADIHTYCEHALVRACECDQLEVAGLLIEKGANIDIVIAHFSQYQSCRDIVIMLEEHRKNKPSEEDEPGDDKAKPAKNEFKRPLSETAEFTFGGFSIGVEIIAPGEPGGQRKRVCLAVTGNDTNEYHNFEAKF